MVMPMPTIEITEMLMMMLMTFSKLKNTGSAIPMTRHMTMMTRIRIQDSGSFSFARARGRCGVVLDHLISCQSRKYVTRSRAAKPFVFDQPPALQEKEPVRDCERFAVVRGEHKDCSLLFPERAQDPVELVPCSDIDALGWLIQDEDFLVRQEPPAKEDFLLISAAELPDFLEGEAILMSRESTASTPVATHGTC